MDTLAIINDQRSIKVKALLMGDRLDLRKFKLSDCLSTTPLAMPMGGSEDGFVVLFRYGVLVFFGVSEKDEIRFVEFSRPLFNTLYESPEVEEMEIQLRDTAGVGVQSGVISMSAFSLESAQVVADAISKNLVLSLYEKTVSGEFDRIEPLAQKLAQTGKIEANSKKLLSQMGAMILIEHRMVGRAEIGGQPETLWSHPGLEGLYASLDDEFELKERQIALERKLGLIADTVQTLSDIGDTRQLHKLEWYVIGLILFEIVLSLVALFK